MEMNNISKIVYVINIFRTNKSILLKILNLFSNMLTWSETKIDDKEISMSLLHFWLY